MSSDSYAAAEERYLSSDWAGAAEILERIVAADPKHLDAWIMLAAASRQLKRLERSAEAYAQATELDPSPHSTIWRQHLAYVLEQAGRYDQAAIISDEGPTPGTS